jgi:hypothetical protein
MESDHRFTCMCMQSECTNPVSQSYSLCSPCVQHYRAADTSFCPICDISFVEYVTESGETGRSQDSILNYVDAIPLHLVRCNHWACVACWARRFKQGIEKCYACNSNVYSLMKFRYNNRFINLILETENSIEILMAK